MNTPQNCTNGVFKNSYFFIEVADIAQASSFFQQIPSLYLPDDNEFFAVTIGNRSRTETYYDDVDFKLLNNGLELLHDQHNNLPKYNLERERVVLKNNALSQNPDSLFEVKNYNKKVTSLDKHELFGRVKRKQRQALIDQLKPFIEDPTQSIAKKLQVEHAEVVQLYTHYGKGYGEISWDTFEVSNFGLSKTYSLLKFEIYTDKLANLKEQERRYLNQFYCHVYSRFIQSLPHIKPSQQFGYSSYLYLADLLLPNKTFFEKYPVLFSLGQIFILMVVGFLFIYLFIGRYTKRQQYRKVVVRSHDKDNAH